MPVGVSSRTQLNIFPEEIPRDDRPEWHSHPVELDGRLFVDQDLTDGLVGLLGKDDVDLLKD